MKHAERVALIRKVIRTVKEKILQGHYRPDIGNLPPECKLRATQIGDLLCFHTRWPAGTSPMTAPFQVTPQTELIDIWDSSHKKMLSVWLSPLKVVAFRNGPWVEDLLSEMA